MDNGSERIYCWWRSSGNNVSQSVIKIQGNPVSATAPTAGQFLVENADATGSAWVSMTGDGYLSVSTPGQFNLNTVGTAGHMAAQALIQ